jgi:hypothetical protein
LILLVLDAAASAAFVVPGIIATTLFALVGPVISTRGTTVWAAFRQSVRLVAPQFLLVLGIITLPLAVENEVVTAVAVLVPHENLALVFLSHAALGLIFGLALGLVEVSLAERLLNGAHGPGAGAGAGPGAGASAAGDQRVTGPGAATAPPLRSAPVGTDEGGHHGRDDSRHGHAGTGALPPAG